MDCTDNFIWKTNSIYFICDIAKESQDSSVSMVTRLWVKQLMNCGLITGRDIIFFSFPKTANQLWSPHNLLLSGDQGLYL
jgi:hypothetical protein